MRIRRPAAAVGIGPGCGPLALALAPAPAPASPATTAAAAPLTVFVRAACAAVTAAIAMRRCEVAAVRVRVGPRPPFASWSGIFRRSATANGLSILTGRPPVVGGGRTSVGCGRVSGLLSGRPSGGWPGLRPRDTEVRGKLLPVAGRARGRLRPLWLAGSRRCLARRRGGGRPHRLGGWSGAERFGQGCPGVVILVGHDEGFLGYGRGGGEGAQASRQRPSRSPRIHESAASRQARAPGGRGAGRRRPVQSLRRAIRASSAA